MKNIPGLLWSACFLLAALSLLGSQSDAQVAVRYPEGSLHGFLVLRSMDGQTLAHGDITQVAQGDRITSHMVFHFNDGSIHDETAVFSQRRNFHLLTDHLVQKGPSFPHPQDVLINTADGQVVVHYTGGDGKDQVATEHMNLPPDLANGLMFILLKNLPPEAHDASLSMVVTTPKPRLIKLAISTVGQDPFLLGDSKRKAVYYKVKFQIGGIEGAVAPLVGKQPPDIDVWFLRGDAPVLLKVQGPLFTGGPIWQLQLASPTWPSANANPGKQSNPKDKH